MTARVYIQKRSIFLLLLIIVTGLLSAQTPDANGIVYVNNSIATSGNGSSWNNAIKELADALKAAKTNTAIKEIWVAKGTYYPKYSAANNNFGNNANKDNSFLMVKDVKIFGGFDPANGMTTMATRNPKNAVTTLSGDIDQNNAKSNNVFHVLIAAGDVGTAELDGFTITGGNADNSASGTYIVGATNVARYEGGGIYIDGGSPKLNQLVITDNSANQSAGLSLYTSVSSISNSIITNNTAVSYFGGGMSLNKSPVNLINVLFSNNKASSASGRGGALYITDCEPVLINVTISNNSAAAGGGIYNIYYGTPIFRNSILYSNTPNNLANNSSNSRATFSNSLVGGSGGSSTWVAYIGIDGGNNIDANPLFTNPTANDFTLQTGSPAIGAGNNASYLGLDAASKDLNGNSRLIGTNIDMGAYENQTPLPVIFGSVNAVIKDNQITVAWQTLIETNNSHFLIQASADGNNWKTIKTVASEAIQGNSDTSILYSFSFSLSGITSLTLGFFLLGIIGIFNRKISWKLTMILAALFFFISCQKSDSLPPNEMKYLFLRIVQVDKDGTEQQSKIIKVVQD